MKKYARRDFLKTAAVGTAAIAVLPSLTGLAGVARADGEDDGKRQFSLAALTKSSTPSASTHRLLLDGGGFFNEEEAKGEGGFTHFNPFPTGVVAFGRWRARRFVSFAQPGPTVGSHLGGILTFTVDLRSSTGLRIRNLNMRVVCNFPVPTGFTEGVTLTGTGLPVDFDTAISPPSGTLYSERRPD